MQQTLDELIEIDNNGKTLRQLRNKPYILYFVLLKPSDFLEKLTVGTNLLCGIAVKLREDSIDAEGTAITYIWNEMSGLDELSHSLIGLIKSNKVKCIDIQPVLAATSKHTGFAEFSAMITRFLTEKLNLQINDLHLKQSFRTISNLEPKLWNSNG